MSRNTAGSMKQWSARAVLVRALRTRPRPSTRLPYVLVHKGKLTWHYPLRVIRGSSWSVIRKSYHSVHTSLEPEAGFSGDSLGFRCVTS